MKTGIDTLDFLNRRIRFTDCPDCGGPLIRRKAPELYYFCTRCGKIHDVTEAYWVEDIFWQFVWYHNVIFNDREDFFLGKPSPAKEVLNISKEEMSDATFLVELLCDMDYLEADYFNTTAPRAAWCGSVFEKDNKAVSADVVLFFITFSFLILKNTWR